VYELASIAVAAAWRGRGIARAIIENLITRHPGSLYLTCRASLQTFYEKFNFSLVASPDLPPHFRRIKRIFIIIRILRLSDEELLVMLRKS
jgi:predicted N-acetyltransferase YhbS